MSMSQSLPGSPRKNTNQTPPATPEKAAKPATPQKPNETKTISPLTARQFSIFGSPLSVHQSMPYNLASTGTIIDEARRRDYNNLFLKLTHTSVFEAQFQAGALKKLWTQLNSKEFKAQLPEEKNNTPKAYTEYMAAVKTKYTKLQSDYTESFEKKLKTLGPGYKKFQDTYYAESAPVQDLLQAVLQKMSDNDDLQKAIQKLYQARANDGLTSYPGFLVTSGFSGEEKSQENYCIISISGAHHDPSFITALSTHLKDTIVHANEKTYKILISHRLSDDFQRLINRTLVHLNFKAKQQYTKYVEAFIAESSFSEKKKQLLERFLMEKEDINCFDQHAEDNFKACGERYVLADAAKNLLAAALHNVPYIKITGMDCVCMDFNNSRTEKPNAKYVKVKRNNDNHNFEIMRPCPECRINKAILFTLLAGLAEELLLHPDDPAYQSALTILGNSVESVLTPPQNRTITHFDSEGFLKGTPESDGIRRKTKGRVSNTIGSMDEVAEQNNSSVPTRRDTSPVR